VRDTFHGKSELVTPLAITIFVWVRDQRKGPASRGPCYLSDSFLIEYDMDDVKRPAGGLKARSWSKNGYRASLGITH